MKNKRQLLIATILFCIVILLAIFFKKNILFTTEEIFILKDKFKISSNNSYIELTNFQLEDEIVRIELITPLGNKDNWKNLSININSIEYPLKTNVVTEVTEQNSLNLITCIGEIDRDEFLSEENSIYLITPYENIKINYIKKHKLYY